MFSRITFVLALLTFVVASAHNQSESEPGLPVVVPLHKITEFAA